MISSSTIPPAGNGAKLLGLSAIVGTSLLAAAGIALIQEFAAGIVLFLLFVALALARPRYGLYAAIFTLVVFEPMGNDPFTQIGWFLQSDISSWTPLTFIKFTPTELLLTVTILSFLARAIGARRRPAAIEMRTPLLIFLGLILLSMGWGIVQGGDLTTALWETRALLAMGAIAFLVPNVLEKREHVERVVSLIIVAVLLLSVEIIWRRFVVLAATPTGKLDLAFDHTTPVIMDLVVVLLLARLIWPASLRQRLSALTIPLILYAQMVTERRAGWIGLDIGLILLAIFVFRLRRKAFYFLVLPACLVYTGYLVTFWNSEGTVAQPARAVRSISSPDSRDAASDLYRKLETANLRLNVRANPIAGVGFGHQYTFYIPLPDLSWWPFWHYEAHNSIFWLWMEMGPIGFISFLTLLGAGAVRGVQLLRQQANDRSAPLLAALVSLILMMAVYSYVDVGLINLRLTAIAGLAFGIVGTWGRQAVEARSKP